MTFYWQVSATDAAHLHQTKFIIADKEENHVYDSVCLCVC